MNKNFFYNYFTKLSKIIYYQKKYSKTLCELGKILKILKKRKSNNLFIFGNGGSSAIASHLSIDFSNNHKLKVLNFSDASFITCLSNDYGYENWMSKAIDMYGKKNDVLIVISSSGNSPNIINSCLSAKRKKFHKVITLTGFRENNSVRKLGDLNFWVNSMDYNFVENTHQILLLSVVDYLKTN